MRKLRRVQLSLTPNPQPLPYKGRGARIKVETLDATSLQLQGRGTLREELRSMERGFNNKLHSA
jgi:hypothetical protein